MIHSIAERMAGWLRGRPQARSESTAQAVSHTGDMQACSRHPWESLTAKRSRRPRSPLRMTGWSASIPSRWRAISE